jgi:hypothetical protein
MPAARDRVPKDFRRSVVAIVCRIPWDSRPEGAELDSPGRSLGNTGHPQPIQAPRAVTRWAESSDGPWGPRSRHLQTMATAPVRKSGCDCERLAGLFSLPTRQIAREVRRTEQVRQESPVAQRAGGSASLQSSMRVATLLPLPRRGFALNDRAGPALVGGGDGTTSPYTLFANTP